MKKILFFASALAGLLLAGSCQREELAPAAEGSVVTFEVEIPEIATKAVVDDGSLINQLVYDVYWTDASVETAPSPGQLNLLYKGTKTVAGRATTIQVELMNDKNYVILFWAQRDNTWGFASSGKLLKNGVEFPDSWPANAQNIEAFSGVSFLSSNNLSAKKTVTLKRPFAQINLGSKLAENFTIVPTTSSVTVKNAAASFDLINQVAVDNKDVTFTATTIPGGDLTVNSIPYTYVGMNYIFANGNVEVDYTLNTADEHLSVTNTISNVPVAANYRTNIIGKLYTSMSDYTITLDERWGDEGKNMEVITEGLVKNINGDYEISTDNGLIHAINNLWVDENGVANPKTFYVYPQEYNITDDQIRDVVVTSGTLKVIKDKPVMTRSIGIDGIVIKGLSKPLIASVGEDATVVISGVTIQNYEGDNQKGALVGENDGKVIIEDCAVVDETGADDETTELIGDEDGNGTVTEPEYEIEGNSCVVYDAVQLTAAIAADEVETIVLGADIAVEDVLVFPEGRTATLDLKGYELTIAGNEEKVSSTYAINNHGTLTIKDSYGVGAVNARGIYNGYVAGGDPIPTAKLTIEGGNFNAKGTNGGAAVFNYGVAEVKGGKFTSIGGYSLNNQIGASMTISEGVKANNGIYNSGATLTINGGEIEGNRSGCHVVYSWNSTVTINGGTIHNNNSGNSTLMAAGTSEMTVTGGTFSIKDGRVEGNGNTWTSCLTDTQNTATLTVTGGTFNGGFRVQSGTTMNITAGSFNDSTGSNYNIYGTVSITGGSYTDDTAKAFAKKYAHKDYKLVGENIVPKDYTVQVVGGEKYETLQEAVDAIEDGKTITLLKNISVSETSDPNGNVVYYTGDKSFTIDLDGKTLTGNTSNAIFRMQKSEGVENTITIQNGTIEALENTWSAISIGSSSSTKTLVNLNGLTIKSQKANDLAVRARSGAEFTMSECTVTATNGAGAIVAGGGTVTLDNVTVNQTGVYNWNSVALGISGSGKITVNSGLYTSDPEGDTKGNWVAYIMSSGGTLEINGGTFNGTVAETAASANACGIICADRAAVVNINGGTFNSNGAILDMRNNVGTQPNPIATLAGGDFSADPRVSGLYSSNLITIAEGKKAFKRANGRWTVVTEQATVNNEAELKEAAEIGQNIVLGSDITLTENWTPVGTIDAPFNGIFEGNGKTISGLKVENNEYAAFIAYAGKDAVIKNLTLENVDIKSTKHAAGVVCQASEGVTLEYVTVSGTIEAPSYAGGLLHNVANAVIKNCVNNADISANRAGGIASWATVNAKIENVENHGNITGAVGASGIAHGFAGSIKNAVNYGAVTSNNVEAAAGIAGVQKAASTYEYCYNYGVITSTYDNPNASAAGILGQSAGSASTLKYCANYGTVSAEQSYAAGIAYSLYGTINASYCYNAGTVSGADGAGAIAPKAQYGTTDKASYCLNAGKITSSNGTVYQGSNQNVSSYYYDGTTLKNVADNSEVAEADALAILNGGSDNDFFSTENGKITVK